ncbi:MAG: HD domain-containing protein [Tissierellia bacterium]|nr:HD domain-containing protein [Tissierellia bacterium]
MIGEVFELLKKIEDGGYQAYLVGGCLRDLYLGLDPWDYDIATDGKPEEIKEIFADHKILTHGEKFGTLSIQWKNHFYEITTFRVDGPYKDRRHPGEVSFSDNLLEDLRRRDFTMNAMAMNRNQEWFDPFEGRRDLDQKILRSVGDPKERLQEDALRILRGLRFATTFNLFIEEELFESMTLYRHHLLEISKERIFTEFTKLLLADTPSYGIRMMSETGILQLLFPELTPTIGFDQKTPYHVKTLFDHLLCVLDHTPKKLNIRLAALFHDISKVDTLTIDDKGRGHFYGHELLGAKVAEDILRRLKASNELVEKVRILILDHMKVHSEMTDRALRRQIKRVGRENVLDLYDLMIADCLCTTIDRDASFIEKRKRRVEELLQEKEMKKDHYLAIDGHDIMKLGFPQGKIVGQILQEAKEWVLNDPSVNQREILLKLIKNKFK